MSDADALAKDMVEGHRPTHREYIVAKAYLDLRSEKAGVCRFPACEAQGEQCPNPCDRSTGEFRVDKPRDDELVSRLREIQGDFRVADEGKVTLYGPRAQRVFEALGQAADALEEHHYSDAEHEHLGCPSAKTGIYAECVTNEREGDHGLAEAWAEARAIDLTANRDAAMMVRIGDLLASSLRLAAKENGELFAEIERLRSSRSGAKVTVTTHGALTQLAEAFKENQYHSIARHLNDYKAFISDKPLLTLFAPDASSARTNMSREDVLIEAATLAESLKDCSASYIGERIRDLAGKRES